MTYITPAPRLATTYCATAIFLFALLALVIPSGYSLGAALLLVGGIYAYTQNRHQAIDTKTLLVLLTLALFSAEGIANILWHQLDSRTYDKVIRFILAIPVFYLIRWAKPELHWVWVGLVGGSLGAGATAFFEKFIVGLDRPGGFTHPIQFGNLSMLMGLFCLAGLGWAASLSNAKQRHLFLVLLTLGALGGLIGSLLSGSRGGWVGLPFVLLVLFKAYHGFFALRTKILAIAIIFLGAITIFYTPQIHVQDRVYAAVNDIKLYQQGDSNTSLGARFEMWHGALLLIKEKPLLGWGKEAYQPAMTALADQNKINSVVSLFGHAHNEILDQTAKHGLVGLVLLLALYLVPIWYFSPYLKHPNLSVRAIAVAGTLLAVAYIDFGLSQAFLSHNSGVMMYPFWLVIWAGYLQNTIETYTASAATAP